MTSNNGARERPYLIVLNHFAAPLNASGGTRHVELFSRLPAWETTILAAQRNMLTGRRTGADGGIWQPVWTLPSGGGWTRILGWCSYSVSAYLRGLRLSAPDVVYASSPHLLAGLAGYCLARTKGAHFVLEVRDLWPQVLVDMGQIRRGSTVHRATVALERFLYARAEVIVALSPGALEYLTEIGHGDKTVVIPNAADPSDFDTVTPREQLRHRFGLEGFVVAYAGAHGRANGLDLLLDAASQIRQELPDLRLVLIGNGPMKPQLVRRAESEGLTNVRFLDPIPKIAMPEFLSAVDVGLHVLADVPLFRYGVSPNKLFDYMAAGLPVITNTPGEIRVLVEGIGAGLAVEPDALAQGLRRVYTASRAQRGRWAAAGRRYMSEGGSRSSTAALLDDTLSKLVSRRKAVRRSDAS